MASHNQNKALAEVHASMAEAAASNPSKQAPRQLKGHVLKQVAPPAKVHPTKDVVDSNGALVNHRPVIKVGPKPVLSGATRPPKPEPKMTTNAQKQVLEHDAKVFKAQAPQQAGLNEQEPGTAATATTHCPEAVHTQPDQDSIGTGHVRMPLMVPASHQAALYPLLVDIRPTIPGAATTGPVFGCGSQTNLTEFQRCVKQIDHKGRKMLRVKQQQAKRNKRPGAFTDSLKGSLQKFALFMLK